MQAGSGDQDALVIFDSVLTAFDIIVVDDVGIGDEGDIKASSCRMRPTSRAQSERVRLGDESSGGEGAKSASCKLHIEASPG